jgi:phosphatidylinositol-bisphosphatase
LKYERREDKKKRCPAWCDRVLWVGEDIHQLVYNRSEMTGSDHFPVYALFDIKAKVLVKEKQTQVYQSLVRQLDAQENDAIPKVNMLPNSFQFNSVSFNTPQVDTMVIENPGSVIAQFQFIPKLQEARPFKSWLKVEPEFGIILPGESMSLTVTVQVTSDSSGALTSGRDALEDILIVRLENGRDYFVTIAGDYLKSCFGTSIDFLITCPQPVRVRTV